MLPGENDLRVSLEILKNQVSDITCYRPNPKNLIVTGLLINIPVIAFAAIVFDVSSKNVLHD